MRRKYIFYEKEVEIRKGDIVNPELQLFNSYDTSWPFILILGAFRVICTNGLVVGEKYLHFKKRHIFNFDKIDIREQISTSVDRLKLQTKQWKKWDAQRLTLDIYNNVIESMKLGKAALETVEAQIWEEAEDIDDDGVPIMSLWTFYNVITWYISHWSVSLNHRVEMERRLRSAIGGIN